MRLVGYFLWMIVACPLAAWVAWTEFGASSAVALALAGVAAGIFPVLGGRWGVALLSAVAALGGCALLVFAYFVTVPP